MPSKRPFNAEEYVSLKRPDSPAASPDGEACVFVVSEADWEESRVVSHLWLAVVDGEEFRQITYSHEGEESPSFSPDGAWIAFLSARPDYSRPEPELDEGEEPKTQLWVLPAAGGEARCLTDAREGVKDYDWLPDGSGMIYLTEEARPKALQAHHINKQNFKDDAVVEHEDRRRIGVWRVEVEEEGENKRIWIGDPGGISIDVSPDGQRAIYVTNRTGDPNDYAKADLWLLDLETGEARPLTERPGAEWSPQWSPDGSRVAFLAALDPEVSYSQTQLWSVPVEGGEISRPLPDFDREIEGFAWPRRSPDDLYFLAAQGLYNGLFRLHLPTGEIEPMTETEGVCSGFDMSDAGETAYLLWENGCRWPDLYALDRREEDGNGNEEGGGEQEDSGDSPGAEPDDADIPETSEDKDEEVPLPHRPAPDAVRLTDLNPEWREVELGPQRAFAWECEGSEIEGLLVLPPGAPADAPLPLIVYIHGGPHAAARNTLRQGIPLQWLARLGYAVLAPNYRGSDSYGAAFAVANRGDLGGGDYRDVMAGVDAAVAAGIADPDRLAIMGGSYGGYMTNWAISQTERFRAAVSLFGIFNWITDFSNSEISHFEKEYFGRYYWEDPTFYFERSPFRYVDRIRTPVLIMHGEDDPNTFISNSREMYQALRALGRAVKFVRYPREGHGFHEPRHRVDTMQRVATWLDAYLMGEGVEKPAAYRMDQDVPGEGGWSLRVTSADAVKPVGHKEPEESLLVNLVFVVTSDAKDARFEIRMSEVRAEAGGKKCSFLGVPVKTLDETILTGGKGLRVIFQGEEPPSAFPVAMIVRAPKGPAEMTVTVPGFPPIIVPMPKPDADEDEKPTEEPELLASGGAEESAPQPGPVQKGEDLSHVGRRV
ncbi:MAG: S9 family peptidase [Armatimonadetes bacterium]|nr:S9 family peptidase [Armatimonadota bacterium]